MEVLCCVYSTTINSLKRSQTIAIIYSSSSRGAILQIKPVTEYCHSIGLDVGHQAFLWSFQKQHGLAEPPVAWCGTAGCEALCCFADYFFPSVPPSLPLSKSKFLYSSTESCLNPSPCLRSVSSVCIWGESPSPVT